MGVGVGTGVGIGVAIGVGDGVAGVEVGVGVAVGAAVGVGVGVGDIAGVAVGTGTDPGSVVSELKLLVPNDLSVSNPPPQPADRTAITRKLDIKMRRRPTMGMVNYRQSGRRLNGKKVKSPGKSVAKCERAYRNAQASDPKRNRLEFQHSRARAYSERPYSITRVVP